MKSLEREVFYFYRAHKKPPIHGEPLGPELVAEGPAEPRFAVPLRFCGGEVGDFLPQLDGVVSATIPRVNLSHGG